MAKLIEEDFIPIRKFIFIFLKNWLWFIVSIFICLLISLLVNRYTVNVYSNSIKINLNTSNNDINPLSYVLDEQNNRLNSSNFSDKIFMIKSYPLIFKTVKDLGFETEYFIQGNIKTAETYKFKPILFNPIDLSGKYGLEFNIDILNENQFKIKSEFIDDKIYQFNEVITTDDGAFSISRNNEFDFNKIDTYSNMIVKWVNPHNITKAYKQKIDISRTSKDASIVNISIQGEDLAKETDFLNKLCQNYIENDLNTKNNTSINTIRFIDNQIKEIKDSLNLIEAQLQLFKKDNGVVTISLESEKFYNEINELQNEKSKLLVEKKYFDYLTNYLSKKTSFKDIIIPVSYGISNNLLNDLITQLVDLQLERDLLNPDGNLINPVVSELNGKINRLNSTLKDMISNLQSKNDLLINDFTKRIKISEDLLASLPSVERELINIERHYDLSESIYLLLMTKRTEAGILAAGNVSDALIVEPAIFQTGVLVSPNKKRNYLLAFLIGLFLPLSTFTLIQVFYDKITDSSEIESNSNIPFLGYISTNKTGFDLIVNEKPKSRLSESFRNIRSNIEFLLQDDGFGKSILFTSSISGEGKTFCAKNLATVYAISGKKTILVGADLRKPKLYLTFSEDNKIGLSTYLSGNSTKKDIIQKTKIENLDYISSGPVPPNPAELIGKDLMKDLILGLRKEYDYVIIDTPPMFIVSDSLPIMNLVDLNIYVFRQNYTKSGLLNYVNNFYDNEKLKNLSILLNDVDFSSRYGYNYGYNYGYKYGYNYEFNYGGYYDEES